MPKKNITLDIFMKNDNEVKKYERKTEIKGPYDLPDEWKWVKLEEVCWINREKRDPAKEMPDKEFIYIDISSIEEGTGRIREIKRILGRESPSRARRVIHTDDVIMSTVRPYLKAFAIIPKEFDNQICSTGFAVLTSKGKILPKFLLYALFSDVTIHQCNEMMVGAHYPALRIDQVARIKIPLPPLEEQKYIVSRLEQLINRAEEAKRLRKLAKEETEKIMQAALHKVFNRAEERGWELVRLGNLLIRKPQYGLTARSSKEVKEIRYIRISDITDYGELKNDDPRFLDLSDDEYRKYKLEENDILIARSGSVGRVYLHKTLKQKCVFASYLIRFKLNPKRILPKFFFYFGLSPSYKRFIENTLRIVAQPNINAREYCKLQVPLPPLEEQKNIIAYLDKISKITESLRRLQQSTDEELEQLVPAILDKAFKGRL